MIAADTNVMLRVLEPGHPHCQAALDAMYLLRRRDGETFCSVPHCLFEVYHVATRQLNGHGKTAVDAAGDIHGLQASFPMVSASDTPFNEWLGLVKKYGVTGRQAYDTKIVAALVGAGVAKLLSFNDADFRRYTEIVVLNPFDVLNQPRV